MSSNIRLQKTCQHCGNRFAAKTTVTQFCSDTCAKKAYKQRKRDEKIEVAIKEETEKFLRLPAYYSQSKALHFSFICHIIAIHLPLFSHSIILLSWTRSHYKYSS